MSDNPSAFAKIVGLDPSNFSRKLKKQQPITEKDIYIDFDRTKVDRANRKVLDWVLYSKC